MILKNPVIFFKFIKYADDTTLFCKDTNHIIINFQLGKILQWLQANKLSLNIGKTKFMMFHNSRNSIEQMIPFIEIQNINIERVHSFNYLGVTIDQHLDWNQCPREEKNVMVQDLLLGPLPPLFQH